MSIHFTREYRRRNAHEAVITTNIYHTVTWRIASCESRYTRNAEMSVVSVHIDDTASLTSKRPNLSSSINHRYDTIRSETICEVMVCGLSCIWIYHRNTTIISSPDTSMAVCHHIADIALRHHCAHFECNRINTRHSTTIDESPYISLCIHIQLSNMYIR